MALPPFTAFDPRQIDSADSRIVLGRTTPTSLVMTLPSNASVRILASNFTHEGSWGHAVEASWGQGNLGKSPGATTAYRSHVQR